MACTTTFLAIVSLFEVAGVAITKALESLKSFEGFCP